VKELNVDYLSLPPLEVIERLELDCRLIKKELPGWICVLATKQIQNKTFRGEGTTIDWAMRQALQYYVLATGYVPQNITPKKIKDAARGIP
jgi:hypothetical protein